MEREVPHKSGRGTKMKYDKKTIEELQRINALHLSAPETIQPKAKRIAMSDDEVV